MLYSQQILSEKLSLVAIDGQKSKLSDGFKLELVITYYLEIVVKCL